MSDAQLDQTARPFRAPDTTGLKLELEKEIRKIFPRMPPNDAGKPPKFIHFINVSTATSPPFLSLLFEHSTVLSGAARC